jgi:hypothetical protein
VKAGNGVVYPGVTVVDAGCRGISVVAVAAAAEEVAIYDLDALTGGWLLSRNVPWRID